MSRKSDIPYPPMADPVIGWLCHRHKWKDWQVIGLIMAVAAVIMLGIGSFASQQYSGPGRRISSIDNIAFILAWILMFLPLIWKIYLWQGYVVGELFNNLNKKMIFGRPNTERYKSVKTAAETIHASLSKPWVYFLVFVLLVGFWVYEIGFGWPQQIMVNGPQYWLEVKWYFPLHVFAWALGLYAVFTLAIRQAMIVFGISSVLRDNDVDVNPYDPDEAGGLGGLGDYIRASILFVIGIGVLAALFAVEVAVAGAGILDRYDVLGLFLIYILLASLSLIVPTEQARDAMLRARQSILEPIAEQIQETFEKSGKSIRSDVSTNELKDLNSRLIELQKHYELIMQSYPITPMTIRSLRSFSFTAILPLISGIVSIALQLFK